MVFSATVSIEVSRDLTDWYYNTLVWLLLSSSSSSYVWLKNGMQIPPGPNIIYAKEGVVQIKPLTSLDEGYYQCRASNTHGVALSNVTVLQRAVLQPYGQAAIDEKRGLVEGQPFKLGYLPTKCVPRPAFMWGIADDIVDKSQVTVTTSQRIQIDDDGKRLSDCPMRCLVFSRSFCTRYTDFDLLRIRTPAL